MTLLTLSVILFLCSRIPVDFRAVVRANATHWERLILSLLCFLLFTVDTDSDVSVYSLVPILTVIAKLFSSHLCWQSCGNLIHISPDYCSYFLCLDAKKVTKKNQGQHEGSACLSGLTPHIRNVLISVV